ncbi:MAG: type II toxin-antitoxin system death-on-curing family toxin [Phycisphaerales bacterium]|jgi:death-on-curing protein|nr:type II toxin-antitoxin system death-on-curing family toxin [Phycisphaerales bacterium]
MTPGLTQPRFIGMHAALAMHDLAIAQFGGAAGLSDAVLLEAALAQASAGVAGAYLHEFPFGMASAYAFHIAKNHPFVDGNKRVALVCAGAFLRMNGWNLSSEGTAAADAVLSVVDGTMSKEALSVWFRTNSRERPRFELRDFFSALELRLLDQYWKSTVMGNDARAQFRASAKEAAADMPVLRELERMMSEAEQRAMTSERDGIRGGITLLVAMHRIAEELGYEW